MRAVPPCLVSVPGVSRAGVQLPRGRDPDKGDGWGCALWLGWSVLEKHVPDGKTLPEGSWEGMREAGATVRWLRPIRVVQSNACPAYACGAEIKASNL